MKKHNLDICVIGAGFMGTTHLKMYKMLNQSLDLTVVDSDLGKKKIAREFKAKFYNNVEQALKGNKFDIVDICLPTYLHYPVAKQVLANSESHLLIEKPLALNYKQAKELVRLIQKKKKIGVCAHVERFFQPMIRTKRWCVQNNPPYYFTFVRRTKKPKRSDWFAQKKLGGGVLLDLGIHDIDLLLWFTKSEIIKIRASGGNKTVMAKVAFKDGSKASIQSGWDLLEKSKFDLVNQVKVVSGKNKIVFDSTKNAIQKPRYPDAYFEEIKHIVNCVLANQKPKIDFTQAARAIKVVDTIKKSIKENNG